MDSGWWVVSGGWVNWMRQELVALACQTILSHSVPSVRTWCSQGDTMRVATSTVRHRTATVVAVSCRVVGQSSSKQCVARLWLSFTTGLRAACLIDDGGNALAA
jgi:hypothetical protein